MITAQDKYQTRGDTSATSSETLGSGGLGRVHVSFRDAACLCLRFDFVEVVLTYFRNFRIATKERRVHLHHRMFLWIDYNIVDTVFREQVRGVRRAGIYF